MREAACTLAMASAADCVVCAGVVKDSQEEPRCEEEKGWAGEEVPTMDPLAQTHGGKAFERHN